MAQNVLNNEIKSETGRVLEGVVCRKEEGQVTGKTGNGRNTERDGQQHTHLEIIEEREKGGM